MGVEGKRLLVLGAGRGQIGLYKAAKEMGITTIAGTMPDNNPPGIPLADEVCFMNIANPDEVAKKAANLKLDGVATCCLDTGISALGKYCTTEPYLIKYLLNLLLCIIGNYMWIPVQIIHSLRSLLPE